MNINLNTKITNSDKNLFDTLLPVNQQIAINDDSQDGDTKDR